MAVAELLKVAVIVTVVADGGEVVLMVNVALVAPVATVTVAATFATVELLVVISTSAPPSGAGDGKVTVACGCPCPWIADGVINSEPPASPGA